MATPDTSLGGERRGFPETTWGLVSRLTDPSTQRAALETLCARYWKPVYRYVRIAWSKSNEDAKDLAQAFFAWLLEGDALARYRPEKGGFRAYLKTLLRRFVGHQELALQRVKRGGGVIPLPLDTDLVEDPKGDPEKAFDRAWVVDMVNRAIDRVRARGPEIAFRVYESYELVPPAERPTYVALAARLGIGENDVKAHLFAVRGEVRAELRAELVEITGGAAELEEEWQSLFGA
jgi:RNA polymerase sigma-70 factor (ECF subfamily)